MVVELCSQAGPETESSYPLLEFSRAFADNAPIGTHFPGVETALGAPFVNPVPSRSLKDPKT